MKKKRPVLYELVRKTPRDAAPRPRPAVPPVTPPAAPRPMPSAVSSRPTIPAGGGRTEGNPESAPGRSVGIRGSGSAVATAGVAPVGRPLQLGAGGGASVADKLRAALRTWSQSIQSAPPWATVLGLIVSIAFFVLICFQLYRAFAVKDVSSGGDSTAPPAAPAPRSESPPGKRETVVPSIGGSSRVATPIRTPDASPEPKADVSRTPPKDEAAASPPTDAALPVGAGQFEKGAYYVHIQHFMRGRRDAAVAAHQFLRQEGIACSLIDTKADLVILSDEPFQLATKDAKLKAAERKRVEDLKKRIRDLGKKYVKSGGGYSFRDCEEKAF